MTGMKVIFQKYQLKYKISLPSSSAIVILVLLGLPRITLWGSNSVVIMRVKLSLSSNILSSIIEILTSVVFSPGEIVTLYGPET